jgi:hypothetical protein
MNQIKEMVKPLYDSGDLLGFSVCGDTGSMIYNESFFNDELAWRATVPFISVTLKLGRAGRIATRLTVELDDVTLIYKQFDQGHALFFLRSACDLDTAAAVLS